MDTKKERIRQMVKDWVDSPPRCNFLPREEPKSDLALSMGMALLASDPMWVAIRRGLESIADFMRKDMLAELGGCDPGQIDHWYALTLPLVLRGKAPGIYKKYLDSLDTLPYWASSEWWESSPD